MPAVLTQLVYLKMRAGAPAVSPIFQPTYRTQVDSETIHRIRSDAQTTHRARRDAQTIHRVRVDA